MSEFDFGSDPDRVLYSNPNSLILPGQSSEDLVIPGTRELMVSAQQQNMLDLPRLSNDELRVLRLSSEQAKANYQTDIGFSPVLFSQVSLPYRKPDKDAIYWERRNGEAALRVVPLLGKDSDGQVTRRYPFGVVPRLLVAYLTSEAKKNNSRTISLGANLNEFVQILGMGRGGQTAARLREQLAATFGSTIEFDGLVFEDGQSVLRHGYFRFADHWDEIINSTRRDGRTPDDLSKFGWVPEVQLSERYFKEIDDRSMPIDLKVLAAIRHSAMSIDIYLWLTHKMYSLESMTRVKWSDLQFQFGTQFERKRSFRAYFTAQLAIVQAVYPGLKVEATADFLILRPSPTSVTISRPRKRVVPKALPAASTLGDVWPGDVPAS